MCRKIVVSVPQKGIKVDAMVLVPFVSAHKCQKKVAYLALGEIIGRDHT